MHSLYLLIIGLIKLASSELLLAKSNNTKERTASAKNTIIKLIKGISILFNNTLSIYHILYSGPFTTGANNTTNTTNKITKNTIPPIISPSGNGLLSAALLSVSI